ncbi:MAG: glutamate--tRNA ligase family protein [Planctomycetales bacterium]
MTYRGRLAPTPSGYLHLGHASTFQVAADRARQANGALVMRIEDLDQDRCREEFVAGAMEDLRWLGLTWQEGPDVGGPLGPYVQSKRLGCYLDVWRHLAAGGCIYPSPHSRKDVTQALSAPHDDGSEPLFPPSLRPTVGEHYDENNPGEVNWRFRVPDGEVITFLDGQYGAVTRVAGKGFGDFLVWRKDGFPSYELAVVADDHAMQISEVVRGADLLTSTARQLLLYRALGWNPPRFFHVPLLCDAQGERLAKRDAALTIRTMRTSGMSAREVWERAKASPHLESV